MNSRRRRNKGNATRNPLANEVLGSTLAPYCVKVTHVPGQKWLSTRHPAVATPQVRILHFDEGIQDPTTQKPLIWDYYAAPMQVDKHVRRSPGAFRAFSVADLQRSPPVITLTEWTDLCYENKQVNVAANYPNYAAISHVWQSSKETADISREKNRPLWIAIDGEPRTHEITWHGLVEAANAAEELKCEYLWLDLLCIDQVKRVQGGRDKPPQIANMANIYKYALHVICMLGGVSAVQSVSAVSPWADRAWTLQEAILNNRTWAYAAWKDDGLVRRSPNWSPGVALPVRKETRKYLIPLEFLSGEATDKDMISPMGIECGWYNVHCLDGVMNRSGSDPKFFQASTDGSSPVRAILFHIRRGGADRLVGAWIAMFLRTSTRPVDIVYSVIGIFNVEIDYDEDRGLQGLYNELACKAALRGGFGLGWLTMGGLSGSVGILERDESSLLIPKVPIYPESQGTPYYLIGGKHVVAGLVFAKGNVIHDLAIHPCRYHIKFDTDSHPHIVCTAMFEVAKGDQQRRRLTLRGVKGDQEFTCDYQGIIHPNSTAILVATHGTVVRTHIYALFIQWTKNGWELTADGKIWDVPWSSGGDDARDEVAKLPRRHFTMGKGAQKVIPSWPCDHENSKISITALPLSYGVLFLESYFVGDGSDKSKKVAWFGRKASTFFILVLGFSQMCLGG